MSRVYLSQLSTTSPYFWIAGKWLMDSWDVFPNGLGARSSANWGVYSFVFLSSVSFYSCSKKHEAELEQIQTVIEKLNQLKQKNVTSSPTSAPLTSLTPEEEWRQRETKTRSPPTAESTPTTSTLPVRKSWWFW